MVTTPGRAPQSRGRRSAADDSSSTSPRPTAAQSPSEDQSPPEEEGRAEPQDDHRGDPAPSEENPRRRGPLDPDGRPRGRRPVATLMLGAAGVVFGDIGTSPLYSLQTVFSTHHNAVSPSEQDVLGVISMIVWCLILIVTVTYVGVILRADNQGEGGILSLANLIQRKLGTRSAQVSIALVLAIIGATLFYGDSVITPAISVLSAFEGLQVVSPALGAWVVPAAVAVLTALFLVQRWGTGAIGRAFGPIMVCWFLTIAALGLPHLLSDLSILRAVSPSYAIVFAMDRPVVAFIAMGAVVLAITGAEALYADMGHFGRRPIAPAWLCLILPSLLICYFGQGALILSDPTAIASPFFRLAPSWARIPLVVLAAMATVIASQAVISGAFSVSRQATRLGLLPRLKVLQTSKVHGGQIYLPMVNLLLFLGVLTLVLAFRSSESLASAYGLSVTGTLLLELSLFLLLALRVWNWPLWRVVTMAVIVGGLEAALFAGNVVKIASGGWLPLMIAAVLLVVMLTWRRGAREFFGRRHELEGPIDEFVREIREEHVRRVPGLAVYPHGDPGTVPLALRSNLRFNRMVHRSVVIITIRNVGVPHVLRDARVEVSDLGDAHDGIVHVTYRVGFNDSQDIPAALADAVGLSPELDVDPREAIYFLSVFRIEPGEDRCMPRWQKGLFRLLEKTSANKTHALHLPPERTVVMGAEAQV